MATKPKTRGPDDREPAADESQRFVEERIALALHEVRDEERQDPSSLGLPAREYQELWFSLSRRPWRSLALVPGDAGGSAKGIAAALATVGRMLHEPVTTLTPADSRAYVLAAQLLTETGSASRSSEVPSVWTTSRPGDLPAVWSADKTIAVLPPVVSEPLGLKVIAAAELAVICVEVGRTRMSALRRTIELVGRERITGCLLIN